MDFFAGEIRTFAGSYAPANFLICDGSLLPISNYQLLYTLLGTTYGGNGTTTFGIPDLRGRLAVGQGTGPGLTPRALGSQGGAETVQLTEATIPSHTHNFTVSTVTSPASVNAPAGSASYLGAVNSAVGVGVGYVPSTAAGVAVKPLGADTISFSGGGAAHNNLMPFVCINYIICFNGLFPSKP